MPYYIKNRGKAFGPFSEQQLVDFKTRGRISGNTEVSEDQTNWFTAASLPFLGFAPQMANSGTNAAANSIAATAAESPEWFYSTDGKAGYGPVTETAIRQMLQEGTLTGTSSVWKRGEMAREINEVSEFSNNPNSNPIRIQMTRTPPSGSADIWQPLSQSVSWLMFLKIYYLVVLIASGLYLIYVSVWLLSASIGTNRPLPIVLSLLQMTVSGGLYYLQVMAFLSFWKYHSAVQMFSFMKDENLLGTANAALFKFWRWTAIWIIGTVGTILIALLIVFAVGGFGAGRLADLFGG